MKNETKQPLYKVLNEQRTQTEWSVTGLEFRAKSSLLLGSIYNHNPLNQSYEQAKANAQYAALAVNNLANLAEALKSLMEYLEWREDFIIEDAEQNENAYSQAEAALKDIS